MTESAPEGSGPANSDPNAINAMPTKKFFVDILTRDIPLDRAILDLVDNSVDGAKRLRPGDASTFESLSVEVTANKDQFKIKDNCGGMTAQIAREYAFRFGRAKGAEETPFSIGQFGVGMKRALFKMGREFSVGSTSAVDRFELEVDVDAWMKDDTNDWHFDFKSLVTEPQPEKNRGTEITVSRLRVDVSEQFKSSDFEGHLIEEIRKAQQHYIARKLTILVNGKAVPGMVWSLKKGKGYEPATHTEVVPVEFFDDNGVKKIEEVKIRLYGGVSDSNRHEAGWYIFCNGRPIIEADQTFRTGWASTGEDAATIPKFHGQFARFRGYAFFDSSNAAVLPWNTTKTDVDTDNAVYRRAQGVMVDMMRPIIDFLNELDAENEAPPDQRPLRVALEAARLTPVEKLVSTGTFKRPAGGASSGPATRRIAFRKPDTELEELGVVFETNKPNEIGEKAFDYAYAQLVQSE